VWWWGNKFVRGWWGGGGGGGRKQVFCSQKHLKNSLLYFTCFLNMFPTWLNWKIKLIYEAFHASLINEALWGRKWKLRWFPQNVRAIMAKIKLTKKPHGMVIFWIQVRRTYRDLSSQTDPVRENWTWSYPYFNKDRRFALVKDTITHALSILTSLDIKFVENAWGFNRGVT